MSAYDYPLLIKNLLHLPLRQPTKNRISYRATRPAGGPGSRPW